jgi:penicillin-binding protein 1A
MLPLAGAGLAIALLLETTPLGAVPLPSRVPAAQSTRILDRHGHVLGFLHGEENRVIVRRDQMTLDVRHAVIAAEDQRFYQHSGISIPSVIRAAAANVSNQRIVQGGSTITQQYVRNAFAEVGRERSLARKVREAFLALRLERQHSKEEILDFYLNTVYFGRGAYGIEAAARTYFGKHARSLEPWESAFLAGIIRSPEGYVRNLDAARARRDYVLRQMRNLAYLPPAKAAFAIRQPVRVRPIRPDYARAPYFFEHVRRLLRTSPDRGGFGLTDREILTGGLTVRTTLDLTMQRYAEEAVREVFPFQDDPEVGMVAMSTSGEIRAMVGSRHFASLQAGRGFNYATQTARGQGRGPGSAFKPFTLAAFVKKGNSVQMTFRGPRRIRITNPVCDGWSPANYGDESFGRLSVMDATAYSVNTVYAQMVSQIGPQAVVDMARAAGITSRLEPFCAVTLGVFGVTPMEMARGYSTFAARGMRPDVIAITRITSPDGRVIARREPHAKRTIAPHVADVVNQVLHQVLVYGTGSRDRIGREAAAKTGTTESHQDVWFGGYTPHPGLTAVAWVGYPPDKNGVIRKMLNLHGRAATGGAFPGRIWQLFMSKAVAEMPELQFVDVDLGEGTRRAHCQGRPCPAPAVVRTYQPPVVRNGGFPSPSPRPNAPSPSPKPSPQPSPTPSASPSPSPSPSPKPKPSPSPSPSPP